MSSLQDIANEIDKDCSGSTHQVLHICSHCNKEYKLEMYSMNGLETRGIAYNFGNCPHCGKRNDVWIRITKIK